MTASLILLVSGVFVCLAVASALVARAAAADCRSLTRNVRSQLNELELLTAQNQAHIKRVTSSVGALSRRNIAPVEPDNGGLPDPIKDPEKWRAAVRMHAAKITHKTKGDLQ